MSKADGGAMDVFEAFCIGRVDQALQTGQAVWEPLNDDHEDPESIVTYETPSGVEIVRVLNLWRGEYINRLSSVSCKIDTARGYRELDVDFSIQPPVVVERQFTDDDEPLGPPMSIKQRLHAPYLAEITEAIEFIPLETEADREAQLEEEAEAAKLHETADLIVGRLLGAQS